MAESVSNFGYNVLRNNRQGRNRTTTDIAPLVVHGMFIVAWIGIAIYAYLGSRVSPLEIVGMEMRYLRTTLTFSPAILIFIWFCIFLIVFYFIMLRWCTKFSVYLAIFLEFLLITLPLILIDLQTPYVYYIIPTILICYFLFWIEIQIVRKVGVQIICKIIVDGCKATIAFPSSLIITFLSLFSTFLFCTFVATVIYGLANIKPIIVREGSMYSPFEEYSTLENVNEMRKTIATINALMITFLLISGWILLVENLCMLSVLHGVFTSWCRMTNKSVIPIQHVLRYWFYACRYHIGSFAFMTMPFVSLIQVIRTICANTRILEMKFKETPYNTYCFLVILVNIVSNASIACASYGKCFYPSMKDAFKILLQHPMKFAAVRLVVTGMTLFGLILIPSIMIGIACIHTVIWNPINYGVYLVVSGLVSLIITTVVLVIFGAAVDSVLFCHLEDELDNSKASEARA